MFTRMKGCPNSQRAYLYCQIRKPWQLRDIADKLANADMMLDQALASDVTTTKKKKSPGYVAVISDVYQVCLIVWCRCEMVLWWKRLALETISCSLRKPLSYKTQTSDMTFVLIYGWFLVPYVWASFGQIHSQAIKILGEQWKLWQVK